MHLSLGQTLRLAIQAVYFVLIARSLGPQNYGAFVAVVSLAAILGPFSGMGTPNLFIKQVRSGEREAAVCWGNGLLLTVGCGSILTLVVIAVDFLFHLRASLTVVVLVCMSDLIFMKVIDLAAFGFGAADRMKELSIQTVVVSVLRLSAIASVIAVVHSVRLNQWAWAYLSATVLGMIYAVWKGSRVWGKPRVDTSTIRADISEGIFFSISTSATSIYNDVDKIMLGRLSDFAATGIYSAAYRLIDVSMTPVRSLVSAAYPQFFQKGVGGMRETYAYAKRLIRTSSLYGLAIFVGLWVFAPLLPAILGRQYAAAVPALRWLALIPFLRCFHVFLADSLSGAGFQRTRTVIQVLIGVINVGLNLVILPRYSWRGAAWTSLACDGMLVVVFSLTAGYLYRRQQSSKMNPFSVVEPT